MKKKTTAKNPLITTERIVEVLQKTTTKTPDKNKLVAELTMWLNKLGLSAPGYQRQVKEIIDRNL